MDLSGTNVYVWVQNGLTLNADQDLSGFGSALDFVDWSNPQTVEIGGLVSGATITLGNSNANMWNFTSNSYAVTFGPGITINATGSNTWISGGPFINQGLIEETGGGVLTINSGANGWTNYGIISVTNEGTLNLYGTWTNYGTILVDPSTVSLGSSVNIDPTDPSAPSYYWTNLGTITIADGSTINLGGVFLSDTFDGMNLTGDTLNLTGTMDNSVAHNPAYHGVLNLNSSTGSLTLLGGRIYQGEVVNTDGSGSTLIATTSGGTLDGVTLDVSMDLSGTNVFVWVQNGLTLNADQDLSGVGSSLAFVDWSNPQTVEVGASVSGAAITLSGTWANMTIFTSNSYAVTFGTGITINANGPWNWIQGPFDNQGLIEETGGVLTIDIDNYNTYNNAGNLPSTAYSNFNMIPWTNEGTIQVTSGELLLGGPWTNTTSGTISATPGTLLYLGDNWNDYSNNYFSYYNTWTNNGTISTSNANVCLGGGLTYDSTNFQSIGGLGTDAVYLIGTLDNYGNTLTLTAGVTSATGSWYIDGGRIDGGTVASASPGADLIVTNMDWWSRGPKIGMLDGVTLDANLDMASNYGASLLVRDGLTLNGTISLGNPSGGGSATLYFDNCWNWGGRTLSGTGSIVFGGGSPSSLLVANWEFADYHQYWYYYAPLTIDSGITIDGPGTGITGNITGPIDNYADIEEAAGGTLAINFDNHNDFYYPGQWVNDSTGTIHVGGGSTLELGGAWSNYGTIAADPGANLYLGDNWNDTSVNDYFFYDNQYFYYNNTWANYGTISTTSTNVYLGGWLTYGNSNFQSIGGLGTDTVSLIGTLGNYWWNTLTLEAGVTSATGSWNIDGGRIYEGTVASASPGADLIATSAGGTLDGVTLDANLDMASNYGATITVRDGLTLNGTIYLGGPSGSSASLHFDDYWNWGGRPYQATVPSSSAAAARVSLIVDNWESVDYQQYWYYYAPLTIGFGITIDGPGTGVTGNIIGPIDNFGGIEDSAGGTLTINVDGGYSAQWFNDSTGSIHVGAGSILEMGGDVSNAGSVAILGTAVSTGTYSQSAGSTKVNGTLTTPTLNLYGGILLGTGTITGDVNNIGGTVTPGDAPGTLSINGNYTQDSGGTLDITVVSDTLFSTLAVSGAASVGGVLNLDPQGSYNLVDGTSFQVITFASETGDFATKNLGYYFVPVYDGNDLTLCFEPTVGQMVFLVTNTDDSGAGSLRQAILDANAYTGPNDVIQFDITGSGVQSIVLQSALPTITDPVEIDGWSQPGWTTTPLIELNGTDAGGGACGLFIDTSNCAVLGLVIDSFGGSGIVIAGGSSNWIAGNYIGTNTSGTASSENGNFGVLINGGAKDNIIGGAAAGDGNVISGNGLDGIRITDPGTDNNVVDGNYIGTDATGTVAIGNGWCGVQIVLGAQYNQIGCTGIGESTAERNIISGNDLAGVYLLGAGTNYNTLAGNYIGTDATGEVAVANGWAGFEIHNGAQHNTAEGNLISGNDCAGVWITDQGTNNNVVEDNYIGTNAAGNAAIRNGWSGVTILAGAQNNITEGNIISGNGWDGVDIYDSGTSGNIVAGNYIGTDISGTMALGNGAHGVEIWGGATDNLVGVNGNDSDPQAEGNLISANHWDGVNIYDSGTSGNIVAGNYIGTDISGTMALGNGAAGVEIWSGATGNLVGVNGNDSDPQAERNLISGNQWGGVEIHDYGTSGNIVAGNKIGTDISGTIAVGNSRGGGGDLERRDE